MPVEVEKKDTLLHTEKGGVERKMKRKVLSHRSFKDVDHHMFRSSVPLSISYT